MNKFPIRFLAFPIAGIVLSVLGVITNSWLAACGLAFLVALGFTVIENDILRRVLFGKIGKSTLTWWIVQSLGETVALVGLSWLCFGGTVASPWIAAGALFLAWLGVCRESFKTLMLMVAMGLPPR